MVEDWVNYICPVNGAAEVLKAAILIDAGRSQGREQPADLPAQVDSLDKAHVFKSLSPEEETQFNTLFADLTGTA